MRKLGISLIVIITAVVTAILTSLFWLALYSAPAAGPAAERAEDAPSEAEVAAALGRERPPPVISPSGFIIYDGALFPAWKGNGFIGGLSSKSLVRVEFSAETAREAQRFDMQRRIREVEQGPDGAIWLLEDGTRQGKGALLKLTPRRTD